MFDKLKQLGQLKALQDAAKSEKFEFEKNGVRIVISGDLKVEEIILNPDLSAEEQSLLVKECLNEVIKKAQTGMAQKLAGMNLGF